MKDIGELSKRVIVFRDSAFQKIVEACEETSIILRDNIRNDAPVNTGRYRDSIEADDVETEGSFPIKTVTMRVYSAQTLGERGNRSPRWMDVPLAYLLEWGTGPEGASTGNAVKYGYSYRMDWHGMVARPHFAPNVRKIRPVLRRKIRKAVWEAWRRRG